MHRPPLCGQVNVTQVNYWYDGDIGGPAGLLDRYATLTNCAGALSRAGAVVKVVQRWGDDAVLARDDVEYRFVADRYGPRLGAARVPRALHRAVAATSPDVVHVQGLLFPVQCRALRSGLGGSVRLVAQDHADRPKRGWRRFVQRYCLASLDGVLFTSREQADDAVREGLLPAGLAVGEVMEGSTDFRPSRDGDAQARAVAEGRPQFLWVGHLNANKDPLTVLRGFAAWRAQRPAAHLRMVYRGAELGAEVERAVCALSLDEGVTLVGAVPHDEMEAVYNSAHYLVLGSHREGSGYALCEAMACGTVPIVSDIPSFRRMTAGVGGLWRAGDAGHLEATATAVLSRPWAQESAAARAVFEERLSFPAIARDLLAFYGSLLGSG